MTEIGELVTDANSRNCGHRENKSKTEVLIALSTNRTWKVNLVRFDDLVLLLHPWHGFQPRLHWLCEAIFCEIVALAIHEVHINQK